MLCNSFFRQRYYLKFGLLANSLFLNVRRLRGRKGGRARVITDEE